MATWRDKVWEPGPVRLGSKLAFRGLGERMELSGSWGGSSEVPQERSSSRLYVVLSLGVLLPTVTGAHHQALESADTDCECRAGFCWGWQSSTLCPLRPLLVFSEGTISPQSLQICFLATVPKVVWCTTCQDKLAADSKGFLSFKFWISGPWTAEMSLITMDHHLGLRTVHRWMQIVSPRAAKGAPQPPSWSAYFLLPVENSRMEETKAEVA